MTDGGTFLDDAEPGPEEGPGFCPVCLEDLRSDASCPTCQPVRARVVLEPEPVIGDDHPPGPDLPVPVPEFAPRSRVLQLRETVGGSVLLACWWTIVISLGLVLLLSAATIGALVGIAAAIGAAWRRVQRRRHWHVSRGARGAVVAALYGLDHDDH